MKLLRPADIAFMLLAAALTGISAYAAAARTEGQARLVIQSPAGEWIYPLGTDRELDIDGALGVSHIVISGGDAFFTDSPCGNKLCVMSAPIRSNGTWIACLPNRIVIRVEGTESGGLDAQVY
ncbi:MAG TPA: NusG domain II-containing protein [Candidatus Treponema faecavium]|nr:NusG domain II-containing protein [Candidatus Treponema faecavium]